MQRILYVMVICLLARPVIAGPWVRSPGSYFLQLGGSTIGYTRIYTDTAEKGSVGGKVRDNVFQLFLDAGILDRLSVSVMVPWKALSVDADNTLPIPTTGPAFPARTSRRSGIGDIDLAVKYGLLTRGPTVLSASLTGGIPTGRSNNADGLLLGDGEFNVMPGLSVGHSLYPLPFYAGAALGYNLRSKGFSDDVQFEVETGWNGLADALYLVLLVSGRESTNSSPTRVSQASVYGLATNNQEYLAIVPKLFWKIGGGWGVTASWATAVHGRNVAGGTVLATGISYSR